MIDFINEMQNLKRSAAGRALYNTSTPASSQLARPTPPARPAPPATPPAKDIYASTTLGTGPRSKKGTSDPYAALTNEQKAALEGEMRDAEDFYGAQMRRAMKLPEPERTRELAGIKNRYNTKQSTTRKKYGIRLRERRTKMELRAEHERVFGSENEGPSGTESEPPAKKARTESPRKLVPVSEMGGLSASSATAETTDPTAFINPSQPRYVPQQSTSHVPLHRQSLLGSPGTRDDPMSIDDSDSGSDSDSDSDDDDIPAKL